MGTFTDKKRPNTMVRQADGTFKSQGQMDVEAAYQTAKGGYYNPSGSGGIQSAQEMFDAVYNEAFAADYQNSIIETQLTPAQQEAQLLGLSEQQSAGDLQTMIDNINSFEGQDKSNQLSIDALLAGFSKKSADDALKAKGVILGDAYPFPNQAMDSTEVTQDTVNDILGGAMAAREEIMGGTGVPTKEQELAVQAAVYDLLTDAGIGVDQSTINPYSLEGDALGRFVDRINVVDEVMPDAGGGGTPTGGGAPAADGGGTPADGGGGPTGSGASTMKVPGDTGSSQSKRHIYRLLRLILIYINGKVTVTMR